MADVQKDQERAELHRAIWDIANGLRGAVDGWDFKQYVLGMLFYRYISQDLAEYFDVTERAAGDAEFSYAELSDKDAEEVREETVHEKGYFILPSELFQNVLKNASTDANLNETLDRIFRNIEESAKGTESERNLSGLFDDVDVNSKKLGNSVAERNKRLVKLMNGIAGMKLGSYSDHTIDAFGDAYEYLMSMYASNAGKSGGEFFTPQEVSELLMKLATYGKTRVNKVYDPACGSGSLLLKASEILGVKNVERGYYGQELNLTTYNLARINMFLHGVPFDRFDIALGDTLTHPSEEQRNMEPFEVIVSNPPYSIKWEGKNSAILAEDPRYTPAGTLAPPSKADMAFIMHSLSWLAENGTAAIVCFPGILYRGGAEKKIREYLVKENFVDCVIQLPPNLFFGTSIATCILVLKKSRASTDVLFIDASKEFVKAPNNNKLAEENITRIAEVFGKHEEIPHFSRLSSDAEIANRGYNLSVSTYVEPEDTREEIDITTLNKEIAEIVAKEAILRAEIDKIIAEIEG